MSEANKIQIGGDHYKGGEEHWDRVARLGLDYFQSQITKYVERCWKKNGLEDLKKAQHFITKYIELQETASAAGLAVGPVVPTRWTPGRPPEMQEHRVVDGRVETTGMEEVDHKPAVEFEPREGTWLARNGGLAVVQIVTTNVGGFGPCMQGYKEVDGRHVKCRWSISGKGAIPEDDLVTYVSPLKTLFPLAEEQNTSFTIRVGWWRLRCGQHAYVDAPSGNSNGLWLGFRYEPSAVGVNTVQHDCQWTSVYGKGPSAPYDLIEFLRPGQ